MNGSFRHGDDELLDTLRSAVNEPGEVPPEVLAAANGAFAWRTIDAELAALVEESWAGHDSLVGVRSAEPGDRTLVFRAADTVLEVDVSDDALVGQIDPARSGSVVLECPDGTTATAEIDELGWFTVQSRFSGMVRLRCAPDSAPSFVTEWVRLR
jgi:hypothetical protein